MKFSFSDVSQVSMKLGMKEGNGINKNKMIVNIKMTQ